MGKFSDTFEFHETKSPNILEEPAPVPAASPFPTIIPSNGCHPKFVMLKTPGSVNAENFRILRTKVLFSRNGFKPRVIMVTSALPGEGKSYVAANLAASIALGVDQHVLLVDCDFRRPNLHDLLGCRPDEGLHEYLAGRREIPDLLVKTGISKLTFLPAGAPSENPSELLSSSAMKQFLEEVKGRYKDRYIVIDSTPAQVTAEAGALVNYVDGVLLVIKARGAPKDAVQKTFALMREKLLGIVFNGYSRTLKSYRNYYRKYYKS
jgi:protein-tyrosine kinase